jgi:hypothetical protein
MVMNSPTRFVNQGRRDDDSREVAAAVEREEEASGEGLLPRVRGVSVTTHY